jgi:DNA-directed RNA polymerase specialized sigma24 family protein
VLVLRYSLDLPGEEVARLLGISPDAVWQRLARAKDAFRRVWED